MIIDSIQLALRSSQLDGWLFFDHHRRDPLAYRILNIHGDTEATRRWYYFVPSSGEPRKLVHRIESAALDSLPGDKQTYSSWVDQQDKVKRILAGCSRIAMQYSPTCAIPYISLVDGGTLELVRTSGVEIVSSANLIQEFEARWSDEQFEQHLEAAKLVDAARRDAFQFVGDRLRSREVISEYDVQQFVRRRFDETGLFTNHGPIVAANANASNPHYEPNLDQSSAIRSGDVVLIDLWAKLDKPQAVYYDVTWTGFCGDVIPDRVQNVFTVVRDARKAGCAFVIEAIAGDREVAGYEVDDVVRGHIKRNNLADFFFHRTGHSIGTDVHGTGANMDNLESHDDRRIIANTCFSIEPGVYLPEFGIRSEVNVYVGKEFATVTGAEQETLVHI
jgi:Xaa-Pro dipeptidase